MWTLITGYLLNISFESLMIELFKNKFSNDRLSFRGILLGWFFQEYIREEFEITGGKRFMLEREFRNRFLTQSIKIFRNLILYSHIITILELGTFLFLFGFFIIIIFKAYESKFDINKKRTTKNNFVYTVHNNSFQMKNTNIKNCETFVTQSFLFFYKHSTLTFGDIILFASLAFLIKNMFLQTYFWYDAFFIFRPIFFLAIIIYYFIYTCTFFFLFYVCIIYIYSKNLGLILKILLTKIIIYTINIILCLYVIFYELNIENLTTENYFKESFLKFVFLIFNISNFILF